MPVAPRPSATVVLVRPGQRRSDPWQTYLLRRSARSPVLAEMWVFPGGTVRVDDLEPAMQQVAPTLDPLTAHTILSRPVDVPPPTPAQSFAHFVAAVRELIEEAGVVLVNPDGSAPSNCQEAAERLAAQRTALERGLPLARAAHDAGIALALDRLTYYAHWITPEALPQRFDTRFFLAQLPDAQEATPSPFEMAEGQWLSVDEALDRSQAGSLALHFATAAHLRRLAPYRTLDELFAFAARKPIVPVMPSTREHNGRLIPFLPPDLEGTW